MTPKLQIFISYAHADSIELVEKLRQDLEENLENLTPPLGYRVKFWQDTISIIGRKPVDSELEDAIKQSHYFMLFFSPGAQISRNCQIEWELALRYGKQIILIISKTPDQVITFEEFIQYLSKDELLGYRGFNGNHFWHNFEDYLTVRASVNPHQISKFENLLGLLTTNEFPVDPKEIHDRDKLHNVHYHRKDLLPPIRATILNRNGGKKPFLNIYGKPSSGKSFLALELMNDYLIRRHFTDGIYRINLRDVLENSTIWEYLRDYFGDIVWDGDPKETNADKIARITKEKKYLFVLDDLPVDHINILDSFRHLSHDSQVVITSNDPVPPNNGHTFENCAVTPLQGDDAFKFLLKRINLDEKDISYNDRQIIFDIVNTWGDFYSLEHIAFYYKHSAKDWKITLDGINAGKANEPLYRPIEAIIKTFDINLQKHCKKLVVFAERASIPKVIICTLWGVDDIRADRWLGDLVRHALIEETTDKTGYTINNRFWGYLKGFHTATPKLHARLVDKCKNLYTSWHDVTDNYFSRYLIYHLKESNTREKREELFTLLTQDKHWADYRHRKSLMNFFRDDLQTANELFRQDAQKRLLLLAVAYYMDERIGALDDIDLSIEALTTKNVDYVLDKALNRKGLVKQFNGVCSIYETLKIFDEAAIEKLYGLLEKLTRHSEQIERFVDICLENNHIDYAKRAIQLAGAADKPKLNLKLANIYIRNGATNELDPLEPHPINSDIDRTLYILCHASNKRGLGELYQRAQQIISVPLYVMAMKVICTMFEYDDDFRAMVDNTSDINKRAYTSLCLSIKLLKANHLHADEMATIADQAYSQMATSADAVLFYCYMAELCIEGGNRFNGDINNLLENAKNKVPPKDKDKDEDKNEIREKDKDEIREKLVQVYIDMQKYDEAVEIAKNITQKDVALKWLVAILVKNYHLSNDIQRAIENNILTGVAEESKRSLYKQIVLLLYRHDTTMAETYKNRIGRLPVPPAWNVILPLILYLIDAGKNDAVKNIIASIGRNPDLHAENLVRLAIGLAGEEHFEVATTLASRLPTIYKDTAIEAIKVIREFYENGDSNVIEAQIKNLRKPDASDFDRGLAEAIFYLVTIRLILAEQLIPDRNSLRSRIEDWLLMGTDNPSTYSHMYQLVVRMGAKNIDLAQRLSNCIPSYSFHSHPAVLEFNRIAERSGIERNDWRPVLRHCEETSNNLREFVIEFLACCDVFGDEGYDTLCNLIKLMIWADEHTPFWKDVYTALPHSHATT